MPEGLVVGAGRLNKCLYDKIPPEKERAQVPSLMAPATFFFFLQMSINSANQIDLFQSPWDIKVLLPFSLSSRIVIQSVF